METYKKEFLHLVARFCAESAEPCGACVDAHAADISEHNSVLLPLLDSFDKSIFAGDMLHLECPICLNVPNNIVETPCGHVFCKCCIQNMFRSSHHYEKLSHTSSVECPTCRTPFKVRQLLLSKFLERHISNLTTKCPDCEWTGSQRNYASHLRSLAVYQCPLCFDCIPAMASSENSDARIIAVRKHVETDVNRHMAMFASLMSAEKSDDAEQCSASSSDALDD